MRRFGICEERGSGIDKVVFEIEYYQLPAALFEARGTALLPCCLHSVLSQRWIRPIGSGVLSARLPAVCQPGFMTNTSLRERFGIKEENKAQASRFIKEALDAGKILPYDENAAPKLMKYIPHWARSPVVDK